MAETKVIMPQMGESIFEGTITKWLKKKGDRIERDEPLFEISTDKIDSEIPSPASGVVQDILVNEGQTVQINTVVAVIGDGSAKAATDKPAAEAPSKEAPSQEPRAKQPPDKQAPSRETSAPQPPARETSKEEKKAPETKQGVAPDAGPAPDVEEEHEDEGEAEQTEGIRSSPLVRRIAREHGIDVAALAGKGTGLNGRITKRDILSYIEQGGAKEKTAPVPAGKGAPAAPTPASTPAASPVQFTGEVERVPLSTMRKAIAEHMVMSRRTSAHVTTLFEVDCSRILKAKQQHREEFERGGVRLTVTPFFVQAAAAALKKFPVVNSSLDGDTIVYKKAVNIGIAVNLEWGLIVPVIKNADEKNLLGLAKAVNDIGERARNKKLTPDDVKDGTFTITNPGQYGGLIGTPIINQPQVAIMGMGGIKKRVVVIDDAIAIRPMIMLSLSFDHRVIDGATADQFMAEVQKQLESWPL
jgi:pyruvate dehydrogenase E2 component (dihydrolipoamide acetyltransferase)